MECKEYQEQVSAAVDNCLSKSEMELFLAHVGKCTECRNEYEMESMTKNVVRTRMKVVRTPGNLVQHITDQLEKEEAAATRGKEGWWARFTTVPLLKPAIAFGVACVAVIMLLNIKTTTPSRTPATTLNPTNDVIQQSLANYMAVVGGVIKPQIVSDKTEHLMDYFRNNTDFAVVIPQVKGWKLVGGVLNDYSGAKLAHVMYNHDREVMYLYEACWETVQRGQKLNLPEDVKDELIRTGWYKTSQTDGYSVVLWAKDNTLCSAVAKMDKDELQSCIRNVDLDSTAPW